MIHFVRDEKNNIKKKHEKKKMDEYTGTIHRFH